MSRLFRFAVFTLLVLLAFILFYPHSSHAQATPFTSIPGSKTLIVTKLADTDDGVCDSDCSLREAIQTAPSGATITFAANVRGILNLHSDFQIYNIDLTIIGPGPKSSDLIIQANKYDRLFRTGGSITQSDTNPNVRAERFAIFRISNLTLAKSVRAIEAFGETYISDVTFVDNQNLGPGGATAIQNDGVMTVTNTTFLHNDGGRGCGGAILNTGTLTVLNTTFLENTAFAGGAICSGGAGTLSITNSTFKGNSLQVNSVDASNAGIETYGRSILRNTIVQGVANFPNCSGSRGVSVQVVDAGNNLQFPDQDCGITIPMADPKLGPLQDNGGATQTMALLPGSAAIGKVPASQCPTTDQRNLLLRAASVQTPCDIGAYQTNTTSTETSSIPTVATPTAAK